MDEVGPGFRFIAVILVAVIVFTLVVPARAEAIPLAKIPAGKTPTPEGVKHHQACVKADK